MCYRATNHLCVPNLGKWLCLLLSAIVDVNATSLTTIFTTENKYISKLQVSFLMFGFWNRCVMHRSTLYMVDSSSLFIVSISGKLYHLMLNNESQLVCDVESVLSLWVVSNKHSIGSPLRSSLQSLDGHDGCTQRGSLCINALLHSSQERVDSDHSRETTHDQRTLQLLGSKVKLQKHRTRDSTDSEGYLSKCDRHHKLDQTN